MTTQKRKIFSIVLALTLSCSSLWASDEYEEVSYDQLLDRLSRKKSGLQRSNYDPFESLKMHAGIGLITSAQQVEIRDSNTYRYQNGFELNFGIDLFSPHWESEVNIRNFGTTESGSESRNIREYALKVLHKNTLADKTGYRFGAGLGTRLLRLNDDRQGLAINDSTSIFVVSGGLDFYVSPVVSLGLELGTRQALISRTNDKSSIDASFRFDTRF
jgi:hypothetical protein